jgi:hypothetical protein
LTVWIGGLACGAVNALTCDNADLSAATDAAIVGLPNKSYLVFDQNGRPLQMLLCERQLNNHVGARLIFDAMPRAKVLIADKCYDSDDFRSALKECGESFDHIKFAHKLLKLIHLKNASSIAERYVITYPG